MAVEQPGGMPPAAVLFDLDGTLTDPAEGIVASYRSALAVAGVEVAEDEDLTWMIGPPIGDNLATLGVPADRIEVAVAHYRELHERDGIYRVRVVPGMVDVLDGLAEAGVALGVATAKPTSQAVTTLDHLGLSERFRAVCGASPGAAHTDKAEIVADAWAGLGRPERAKTVVVGDRRHDIEAARANGLGAIGVTWGFAQPGELEAAGCDAIASLPGDLQRLWRPSSKIRPSTRT